MKKIFTAVVSLILLAVILIYSLIPSDISVFETVAIPATDDAVSRFLMDEQKWKSWWPEAGRSGDFLSATSSSFTLNNYTHTIQKKVFNGLEMTVKHNDKILNGKIVHAATGKDSVTVVWGYHLTASPLPLQRIRQYFQSKELKRNISAILNSMKHFLEKPENIYSISIERKMVTDTLLLSTRSIENKYPSNETIYTLIGKLRHYISSNGASETGSPMLNITLLDSIHYQTMVAIPINMGVKESSEFSLKKMVPGRILVAEVRGGPSRIKEAFKQLQYFVTDYKMTPPAIPFETLVTDRQKEKDSTRWITRLCYPVL